MENSRVSRVLCGDMRDLPAPNSKIVRIFTSSTFTDTTEERNLLIESVYPKIQQYCRSKYGLEFQVVDMRWGVHDELTDDHQASALCLQEIQNCQKLSVGPNFFVLLGQRHGSKPFPPTLPTAEFSILLEELEESGEDTSILREWYREDQNAVPPVFLLQAISSRIPDFLSQDKEKKTTARREWNAAFGRMQILLRMAVKRCEEKNKLDKNVTAKYFMSVTESEIQQGIFQSAGDPNAHCLCFIRIIEDLASHLTHDKAWRFIDMVGSDVDQEAQDQLAYLRDEKIVAAVENLHRLKARWSDLVRQADREAQLTEPSKPSRSEYLQQFASSFQTSLTSLIDRSLTHNHQASWQEVYQEVLQHLHAAHERCSVFHGRADVLASLRQLVTDRVSGDSGRVVVVHGASGCGKTSVMAKCAAALASGDWRLPLVKGDKLNIIDNNNASGSDAGLPVVVFRLLGTTPDSSGVQRLVQSLCQQISACYGLAEADVCLPDNMSMLTREFHHLLEMATAEKPLCLVLDSLDQLTAKDNAFKLNWLPRRLPSYATLVVSTLPEMHGILDTLTHRHGSDSLVKVPALGGTTSHEILNTWLTAANRKLTEDQLRLVHKAFEECSLALYVKLVFERVLTWRSYIPASNLSLEFTVRKSINQLFDQLKHKFDSIFVQHVLGYVTASRSGLSETEIEDVLSLDDKVLTRVYQYHIPPVRRIPQLLWLRLRNDLSSYLVTREADGAQVVNWYHRQFTEAAQDYFLSDEAHRIYLHNNMVDYFRGTWHNKPKPFQYNEYQMNKLGLDSPDSSADRKVAAQPLIFQTLNEEVEETEDTAVGVVGEALQYNTRKLMNLPHHIHHTGRSGDQLLREECLYNLEWLHTKVRACRVQAVLSDFELLHKQEECDEWLAGVLRMRKTTLNRNPDTITIEIAGTLLQVSPVRPYLKTLVQDCYQKGVKINSLLPRQLCYNMPGGALIDELEHALLPEQKKEMVVTRNPPVLAALSENTNFLVVWDITNGEIIQEIRLRSETKPRFNVLSLSTAGDRIVCACAFQTTENPVAIYDVPSEELVVSVQLTKVYPKVGFSDSFHIGLMDDKIFINIKGREADCFDLEGKHLYSFDVCAMQMHLQQPIGSGRAEVVFTQKESKEMLFFDGHQKSRTLQATVTVDSTPLKASFSDDGNTVYVIFKESSVVNCIHRLVGEEEEEGGGWEVKQVDILNTFFNETSDPPWDIVTSGPYVLLSHTDSVAVWRAKMKRKLHHLEIPAEVKPRQEKVATFVPHVTSDRRLLVCAYDRHLVVWDVLHGRLRRTLKAFMVPINDLLIGHSAAGVSSDSGADDHDMADVLITATNKHRAIKIWDASKMDTQDYQPLRMDDACRYGDMAKTGHHMVMRGHDVLETRVFDVRLGLFLSRPSANHEASQPKISPDGRYVIVRDYRVFDATLRIFDAKDGHQVAQLPGLGLYHKFFSVSERSQYVLTHAEESPTKGVQTVLWDIRNGKKKRQIKAAQGGINTAIFSNDDRLLLTLQIHPFTQRDECSVLHVYDVRNGREKFTVQGLAPDSKVTLFPKGDKVLAVMLADGQPVRASTGPALHKVTVISLSNGRQLSSYNMNINRRETFKIAHDGRTAVDALLQVFDANTGESLCNLSSHLPVADRTNTPVGSRITQDGRYIVWAVVSEAVVKVARVADCRVIGTCYTHSQPVSLHISHDNIVVIGTYEGIILLLSIVDLEAKDGPNCLRALTDFIEGDEGPLCRNMGHTKAAPLVAHRKASSICSII